jgi:hypothetical protein
MSLQLSPLSAHAPAPAAEASSLCNGTITQPAPRVEPSPLPYVELPRSSHDAPNSEPTFTPRPVATHRSYLEVLLRASPAMNPTRSSATLFFIRMAKNGPVVPPVSRFRPDLSFHPSGEPRPSPPPRGMLGKSGGNKCAGTCSA